jgi:tRNA-2-methylthio-N6-dimethylallyladenosine synthase
VDLFLRPDEEPELAARIGLAGATAPGALGGGGELLVKHRAEAPVRRESATSAWLPIIYGCDKTCTYCIVPFSRGPERSRPFDDVVAEARRLAEQGYREVTLLGQNVNSYGHDLPADDRFRAVRGERTLGRRLDLDGRPDIAALLRAIDGLRTADGVPAIPRLRFVTSHPWDLTDRLIAAMAECPSVCEHLHLPVQSGDDAVLRRMGRQYTVEAYLELVERLRAAIPGIVLTTDVIVGFCGETEAQFENTLELLRRVCFEQVFAAAFSVRPGTPAARLEDDVPRAEKKRRLQVLLDMQEGIGAEANRAWIGRTTEVLVDQVRQPSAHDHGAGDGPRLAGRNRENKLVHFSGPESLLGALVGVRVERAGPYALVGSAAS